MGDVLAAVNIARLSGERVDSRTVEPTAGELAVIKQRSRREGDPDRAIDEALARRVAAGELTVAEAVAAHRGDGDESANANTDADESANANTDADGSADANASTDRDADGAEARDGEDSA
jgi:hypothetical protein